MDRSKRRTSSVARLEDALVGLEEITRFVRVSRRQLMRWRTEKDFPMWLDGERWHASKMKIAEWWRSQ